MDVYLVRHGEAVAAEADPAQPLTERGREEVLRVARHVGVMGLAVAEIRHSTKLRARQTAGILADHLAPTPTLREVEWLAPLGDPRVAAAKLEAAAEPLLVVGHLPHLGRLASGLLAGQPDREIFRFRTATVVSLARTEGTWLLQWILTPDLVPGPARS